MIEGFAGSLRCESVFGIVATRLVGFRFPLFPSMLSGIDMHPLGCQSHEVIAVIVFTSSQICSFLLA